MIFKRGVDMLIDSEVGQLLIFFSYLVFAAYFFTHCILPAYARWIYKGRRAEPDNIQVTTVEPIRCEGCDNVFFVTYGSDEFLPEFCCYCGSELFFDSVEPHRN